MPGTWFKPYERKGALVECNKQHLLLERLLLDTTGRSVLVKTRQRSNTTLLLTKKVQTYIASFKTLVLIQAALPPPLSVRLLHDNTAAEAGSNTLFMSLPIAMTARNDL